MKTFIRNYFALYNIPLLVTGAYFVIYGIST